MATETSDQPSSQNAASARRPRRVADLVDLFFEVSYPWTFHVVRLPFYAARLPLSAVRRLRRAA